MFSDSFFHQGDSHEVCQDYALHGRNYAIVSDGCSNGGGPRLLTDWGSRILAKVAELNIDFLENPRLFTEDVCALAKVFIQPLELPLDCLTATLLCAKSTLQETNIYVVGDGFYGGRRKNDGVWDIFQIEYPSGAPFYLSYLIEKSVDTYLEGFGNKFKIEHLQVRSSIEPCDEDSAWPRYNYLLEDVGEHEVDPEKPWHMQRFQHDVYDTVFVATDGMGSFQETVATATNRHIDQVSAEDAFGVITDILEFRTGFLRLQHNWAFKQKRKGTYLSRNWKPYDDVSVGMIHENP